MRRQYIQRHRVSYAQILAVLQEAGRPLNFEEIWERLPCEPHPLTLESKLQRMAGKGLIEKVATAMEDADRTYWGVAE